MEKLTSNEKLLIDKIGIVDYYNKHIVPLHKKFMPMSDSRLTCLCPFHKDTDPSFHFWKKKLIFHCFGCGVGGNVIRLHQLTRQVYFSEQLDKLKVAESLARLHGIQLEVESAVGAKTVFEEARNLLLNTSIYVIPKGKLTLAEFRQLNRRVYMSNMPVEAKVFNFEELDAKTAFFLTEGGF